MFSVNRGIVLCILVALGATYSQKSFLSSGNVADVDTLPDDCLAWKKPEIANDGGCVTVVVVISSTLLTRSNDILTSCPGKRLVTADVRPSTQYTSHILAPTEDSTDTTRPSTRRLFFTTGAAFCRYAQDGYITIIRFYVINVSELQV